MLNVKDILKAAKQVAEEKGLEPAQVLDAIESSLAAAYKREYGKRGEIVRAKMDTKTGTVDFWQVKTVADESTVRIVEETEEDAQAGVDRPLEVREEEEGALPRYNPERHIFLDEAKKIKPDIVLGEEISFPLESHEDFGRIAAQIA